MIIIIMQIIIMIIKLMIMIYPIFRQTLFKTYIENVLHESPLDLSSSIIQVTSNLVCCIDLEFTCYSH